MNTRTIEAIGEVDADGVLTVIVHTAMVPGRHTVELVVHDEQGDPEPHNFDWLILDVGELPPGFPPAREDLYDD